MSQYGLSLWPLFWMPFHDWMFNMIRTNFHPQNFSTTYDKISIFPASPVASSRAYAWIPPTQICLYREKWFDNYCPFIYPPPLPTTKSVFVCDYMSTCLRCLHTGLIDMLRITLKWLNNFISGSWYVLSRSRRVA